MSAASEVRRLRDWPLGERERRIATALVTVLLAGSALMLSLPRPAGQLRHAIQREPVALAARASRGSTPTAAAPVLAPTAAGVAREFLAGYLAFLHGRSSAVRIANMAGSLERSLRARPPIVSPAMRTRSARVIAVYPMSAPAGLVGVSAVVNDGELASYRLGLLLKPTSHGFVVSAVEAS